MTLRKMVQSGTADGPGRWCKIFFLVLVSWYSGLFRLFYIVFFSSGGTKARFKANAGPGSLRAHGEDSLRILFIGVNLTVWRFRPPFGLVYMTCLVGEILKREEGDEER